MLSLLFDSQFWYGVLVVLAIVAIVYLCFKYPGSRVYVASFACLIFAGLTAYCGIQLNYYYTAEGGIYGKITGIIYNNQVEQLEEAKFTLKNIVLTEDVDGEFSAIIISDKKLNIESTKDKWLFVNGIPCSDSQSGVNGISAKYHYTFEGNDFKELCSDTLKIDFSYFDNGYRLKLSTEGGQTAVDYWNTYFSRNNFVVSVEDFSHSALTEFNFIEGDTSNLVTLTYYVNDEVYSSLLYSKGMKVTKFMEPALEGFFFLGWSLDKVNIINELTVNQDYKLYAVLTDEIVLFSGVNLITFEDINGANIDLTKYLNAEYDLTGANYSVKFECGVASDYSEYSGNVTTTLRNNQTCYIKDPVVNTTIASITLNDNIMKIAYAGPVTFFNDIMLTLFNVILYP